MPVQKRVRANAGYDEQRRKCHEAKKSDRDVGTGAARRQWQLFLNRLEPARVGPSDIVGLLHFIADADKRFADRLGIVDRLFQLLLFGKIVVGIDANHEGHALAACAAGLAPSASRQNPKTATRMRAIAPSQASAGDRSTMISLAINGSKLNRG